MSKRLLGTVAAALLLGNIMAGSAAAQATYRQRSVATLRGLGGVHVAVSPLQVAGAAPDSHPERLVQADVERRLRAAGIAVLTEAEARAAPGKPVLRITIYRQGRGIQTNVHLEQEVALPRDPSITLLTSTWGAAGVGLVFQGETPEKKMSAILSLVASLLQRFVEDYRSVNPPKAGALPAGRGAP